MEKQLFYKYRNVKMILLYRTANQWLRRKLPDCIRSRWYHEKRGIVAQNRKLSAVELARLTRLNWLLGSALSIYRPSPEENERASKIAREIIAQILQDEET